MAARKRRAGDTTAGRARLLDAAVDVIRGQGYSATTVDDICARAGLTKGGFFHHFRSKEDCAVAAAAHFAARADTLFEAAPFRRLADPRERVLGYVEFRKSILQGALPQFTCLLGTMVQEAYETHPEIRAACDRYIGEHAAFVAKDIADARRSTRPMRNGRLAALPTSRNPSSRARSFSPRRRAMRISPPTASIICAAISKACSREGEAATSDAARHQVSVGPRADKRRRRHDCFGKFVWYDQMSHDMNASAAFYKATWLVGASSPTR